MCDDGLIKNPLKQVRDLYSTTAQGIAGEPKASPDPTKERLKAEADATAAANDTLVANARRKRAQKGRLATDINVLASGASAPISNNVLGSGGA
jgi:hypothetical protein